MMGTPEGSTESGFMEKPRIEPATPGLRDTFFFFVLAVFLGCTSTGRVGLCFLWIYVQELPKAQPAVVLVLKSQEEVNSVSLLGTICLENTQQESVSEDDCPSVCLFDMLSPPKPDEIEPDFLCELLT